MLPLLVTLLMAGAPARAASLPPLGTAASFAVLGATTVTNTGLTVVTGDLGVSPGTSVTGFPPGIVIGTIHAADPVAAQAQADALVAYNNAAGQACDTNLTGQDLGGLTLVPGVYCFNSSAFLTGNLTLDGQGNPNAVFIFQIGSTLITASNSNVLLINGARACTVFWQVGSSATLGTGTHFQGNILALASITLNTGASSTSGLYALTGAISLDTSQVQACGAAATPSATRTPAPAPTSTGVPAATNTPPSNTPPPGATNTPPPSNTPPPGATNTPRPINTRPPAATNTAQPQPQPSNTAQPQPSNTAQPQPQPSNTAQPQPQPSNTAQPQPSDTAAPLPSDTAVSATNTAIALATNTAVAMASNTAIAFATNTAVAMASNTAVALATNTAVAVASNTAVALATNTAVAVASNTAAAVATSTAAAAAGGTVVAGATGTPATPTAPTGMPRSGVPGNAFGLALTLLLAGLLLSLGIVWRVVAQRAR